MRKSPPLRIFAIGVFLAAVAACGGGGGGGGGGDPDLPFALLGNTPGTAELEGVRVAFSDDGNGLAVWVAGSEGGDRLLYALYDAGSGSWSSDAPLDQAGLHECCYTYELAAGASSVAVLFQRGASVFASLMRGGSLEAPQALELASDPAFGASNLGVVSNGTGYAASWMRYVSRDPVTYERTYQARASVLSAAGMAWSTPTSLGDTGRILYSMQLASNGSGYMAAWLQDGDVVANHYAGESWLSTPLIIDELTADASASVVASNGTTYQIVWIQDDGAADSVFTREHDGAGALSSVTTLEATGGEARDPSVISNGSEYCVAWLQSAPSDLTVTRGAGTGPWSVPVVLDDPALNEYVSQDYHLATDGTGYAAIWAQDDSLGQYSLWGSMYGGSWSAATQIDTQAARVSSSWTRLASNGAGYMATWSQSDPVLFVEDLWANAFSGGAWQGAVRLEVDDGTAEDADLASRSGEYVVGWGQLRADGDGMAANVRHHSGGAWAPPIDLAESPWGGGVFDSFLVPDGSGLTLAVWQVQEADDQALYTSIQSPLGVWSPPELLGTGLSSQEALVATNGTGFAMAWQSSEYAERDRFFVRIFDGTTWGTTTTFGAPSLTGTVQSIELASNGAGYAVAWAQAPSPQSSPAAYAQVYTAGSWGGRTLLSTLSAFAQSIHIASNGSGYAATWDTLGDGGVPVNVFSGGGWGGEVKVLSPPTNQAFPMIASNGTGYLVYWMFSGLGETTRNVYAAASPTGSAMDFLPAERLSDDVLPAYEAMAASDGTGYALAWMEYEFNSGAADLLASTWDGVTWSSAVALELGMPRVQRFALAGGAAGYAAAWTQREGLGSEPTTVFANVFSDGTWGGETVLALGATRAYNGPDIVANSAGQYAVAWTQEVAGDGRRHVHLGSFDGAAWSTTQLENQAAEASRVRVSADGAAYSLIWEQSLPKGDVLVPLPWGWTRLLPP